MVRFPAVTVGLCRICGRNGLGAEGASVKGMTVHVSNIEGSRAANFDAVPVESPRSRTGAYRFALKRMIDTALVLVVAPFIIPFLLLISALIATDGNSPIFRQERVGKDGRRFMMWKFRTMVPNAEEKLQRYLDSNAEARMEWATKQKLTHDPRITTLGKVLRRSSMDELPQLLNVLMGDMSLVGPRPMMPCQQALYPGQSYYNLRPGLTGPWQVSVRNETEFSGRAYYDDLYDTKMSFFYDVKVIAQTVLVVLRGTGI